MGTEQPDTERMHRLFDDALDDADLTGDVVPGVLTGYARGFRVRRYQAAGVALAVLATAGAAVSALPHGGGADAAAPASVSQGTDYCTHQHWVFTPHPGTVVVNQLTADPAPDQANCEALRTALRSAFPDAQLVPDYKADLTLDSRVDQSLVKKVNDEMNHHDPLRGNADQMKDFGTEMKYLSVHPEDPANVYYPDSYTLVTAAGREHIGIGLVTSGYDDAFPARFVGTVDSNDCGKMPAALKKTVQCTTVGTKNGWHGALWRRPDNVGTTWQLTAVLTDKQGKSIEVNTGGDDFSAWYREGTYDGTVDNTAGANTKWINRWSGQTFVGRVPPISHVVTEKQVAGFLDSSAFQKYADSHLAYVDNLPKS